MIALFPPGSRPILALGASAKPTIAVFPAHPAQVWLLDAVAKEIHGWANVRWYVRDKDVCCAVANALGLNYRLLSKAARGLTGNAKEMSANIVRVVRETRREGIACWLSKYGAANIGARIAGVPSVSFNDDDYDVVPLVAWTSYPFAGRVLSPDVTRMGPFAQKAIRYPSFHELIYLHPNRFTPDCAAIPELDIGQEKPYVLIRLSALEAHHDHGVRGVSTELLRNLLQRLQPDYRVFISSERQLPSALEHFRLPVPIERIHHVLAYATCVIGDSQTMSAEAAVLGTPSLRVSDFVGRISYLDELERCGLTFGFKPSNPALLLARLEWLLAMPSSIRAEKFGNRRARLLAEKVDPVPLFADSVKDAVETAMQAHAQRC